MGDYYMVVGYFKRWLVAINEESEFFVMEEPLHLYGIGTISDYGLRLSPAVSLPQGEYNEFKEEFMAG